jgi:hypothetical protein
VQGLGAHGHGAASTGARPEFGPVRNRHLPREKVPDAVLGHKSAGVERGAATRYALTVLKQHRGRLAAGVAEMERDVGFVARGQFSRANSHLKRSLADAKYVV